MLLYPWTREIRTGNTVLGLSVEYRVPIHGGGRSAGFFDLGWTRLDPGSAEQLDVDGRRTAVPTAGYTSSCAVSWNPLRLNTLFTNHSSILPLAKPRTILPFALGEFYEAGGDHSENIMLDR